MEQPWIPFLAGWTAFTQIVQGLVCATELSETTDGIFDVIVRFLTYTTCGFDPFMSLFLFSTTILLWMVVLASFAAKLFNNSISAIVASALLIVGLIAGYVAFVF